MERVPPAPFEVREKEEREREKEMSLRVGLYVAWALGEENARELHERIGGRVSPVVQPEDGGVRLPYAWYFCSGIQEATTKDGFCGDECQVEIEVVARSYTEMIELAQMVRDAMSRGMAGWQSDAFSVSEQTMSAGPEEYDDNMQAYCRRLIYRIETV